MPRIPIKAVKECTEHRGAVVAYVGPHCPLCFSNAVLRDANAALEALERELHSLRRENDCFRKNGAPF